VADQTDVEGNHHRAEDGDYGEAGQDAAPHEVLENQGAEASITYVTGLNVAATSMGLVSRSRGTKFGVMKSSGKKTRPPELVAAALASRLDDEHALHRLGDETAKHERCARNGAARSLSK